MIPDERCRRCGLPENTLNECSVKHGHDMPPTLESLEQRLIALEELVATKHHIPRPPEPAQASHGLLD
jgi:hypothetical protein